LVVTADGVVMAGLSPRKRAPRGQKPSADMPR